MEFVKTEVRFRRSVIAVEKELKDRKWDEIYEGMFVDVEDEIEAMEFPSDSVPKDVVFYESVENGEAIKEVLREQYSNYESVRLISTSSDKVLAYMWAREKGRDSLCIECKIPKDSFLSKEFESWLYRQVEIAKSRLVLYVDFKIDKEDYVAKSSLRQTGFKNSIGVVF